MIHALVPLVLSLALPMAPMAMPAPQAPDLGDAEVLHWPTNLGSGDFGHVEAARLLPGHGRGVVVQRGSVIGLVHAPSLLTFMAEIRGPSSAFAILPGDFPGEGDLDQLVFADQDGVWIGGYDTTQNPPEFEADLIVGSANLADSFALACADLDGDGWIDIAGIDAARTAVWTLLSDGLGGWSAGSTFAPASAALDLRALEWNGSAGAELAVASTWGTQIFSATGSVLWHRFAYAPGTSDDPIVVMAVVPAPIGTGGADRLAVVQWNQYGTNQLLTLHGASASEPPISLSHANLGLVFEHPVGSGEYLGAVGLHAGDRDGDGDFDLALSHHKERRVQLFANRQTPTTFSANATFLDTIDVGKGAGVFANHASAPLMADLDDDGLAELVFANPESPPMIAVILGSDQIADLLPSCADSLIFDDFKVHRPGTPANPSSTEIGIELLLNNGWNTYMGAAGISHLEVVLWRQNACETQYVNAAIAHHVFQRPSSFDAPGSPVTLKFQIDATPTAEEGELETFFERYYVEVRPVHYDPVTHTISNARRTYAAGFTSALESDQSSLQVLLGRPGASPDRICEPGGANTALNNKYVGGLVPQLRIPDLPPGTLPNIPNPPTVFIGI